MGTRGRRVVLLASIAFLIGLPGWAWTPGSQRSIASAAARLAPPDLQRQIERHQRFYLDGVMAPFKDPDGTFHQKNGDGSGRLDEVITREVERTVAAIWNHQSFRDIVYQAGVVAHYVADANNPLNTSAADAYEGQYFGDYLHYIESAEPRFQVIFYGLDLELHGPQSLDGFVSRTLNRGRSLYPLIGSEYRRIGKLPGRRYFDDRSTAFGVAAVAYSRAVSDVALVLRYIWIEAGGADQRPTPPEEEGRLFVLSPLETELQEGR